MVHASVCRLSIFCLMIVSLACLSPKALGDPQPTETSSSNTASTAAPLKPKSTVTLPSDVTLKPDQGIMRYLIRRGYFNPFPNNLFHPNAPISRAEFITLLYRASGLNTPFVSEFPYFRDVPTNYWAYTAIEGLRIRNMLTGFPEGYFHPEEPLSRMDAGVLMSKTLGENWLKLTPNEITSTLSHYGEAPDSLPDWARYDLARSVYAGFLLPHHVIVGNQTKFALALKAPINRMEAAQMIYRRALLGKEENAAEVQQIVWIPGGITLDISPSSAISATQLAVGEPLYFTLQTPVQDKALNLVLPKGTRIRGRVLTLSSDHLESLVVFNRASLPSGENYRMNAKLMLNFEQIKKDNLYFVPGNLFQTITQPPSEP